MGAALMLESFERVSLIVFLEVALRLRRLVLNLSTPLRLKFAVERLCKFSHTALPFSRIKNRWCKTTRARQICRGLDTKCKLLHVLSNPRRPGGPAGRVRKQKWLRFTAFAPSGHGATPPHTPPCSGFAWLTRQLQLARKRLLRASVNFLHFLRI